MSRVISKSIIALAVFSAFLSTNALAQGPLTPTGAPAATMKTLEQVEPRTPISSVPYSINVSGSYYLTTNLTAGSGENGINVNADNVTIDLNGFTLIGSGGDSGHGIYMEGTWDNVWIRNGDIRNWQGDSAYGIRALGNNVRIRDIDVLSNQYGIYVEDNSIIQDCIAFTNLHNGIETDDNCQVYDCTAIGNSGDGFKLDDDCSISRCTAKYNKYNGIEIGNDGIVTDCAIIENGRDGLNASASCQITGNRSTGHQSYSGIVVYLTGSRIDGNTVIDNAIGIKVTSTNNLIIRNMASDNTISNFNIVAGNKDAQVLTPGTGFTSTDPWANFSF
jgi:parallel beta-helix repeat protein